MCIVYRHAFWGALVAALVIFGANADQGGARRAAPAVRAQIAKALQIGKDAILGGALEILGAVRARFTQR